MLTATRKSVILPSETLVSVVIAVYQGERFIVGAVRSALAQTHRNLEIWVVDDGSTDKTLAGLATIDDPRLNIIVQANAGTAAARNAALARARGRYIAFLDADDRWFPNKLEVEVALLASADGPAIAYSSFFAVDDRGDLLRPGAIFRSSGNVLGALLDGDNFITPSLCLLDREILEEIGFFDVTRYHEDFDLFLRATKRYPAYPTGRRLGLHRHSTDGKCRNILRDYERARREELELADGLSTRLSIEEARRLRKNVLRGLYERFLTYGYAAHARRLQAEVDLTLLRGSTKGRLAILFAWTGINTLSLARQAVNLGCRLVLSWRWRKQLRSMDFDIGYGS